MSKMKGDWIGYYKKATEFDEEKYGAPAPYFRKAFSLDSQENLIKAELKIAALGWFKAYINGLEITKDEEFLTSWTDYNKRIEYITYDITSQIQAENAIGVILGNGWACGSIIWYKAKAYYGVDKPCFIAEIILKYSDGREMRICSDDSWKANVGEIVYNDIFHGEYVDARKTLGDFSNPTYDDVLWDVPQIRESRSNLLTEECGPRTRVMERLPVRYLHTVDGKDVYTTDQNMSGIVEYHIRGEAGTKIAFRYGELLMDDGSLYVGNLRDAEATDTYICRGGGIEVFRPKFTFHGFQYLDITIDGTAEVYDVSALAVYSDLKRTGAFTCSNEIVNKIYSNATWGQKSNFLNLPTDCPQRDERLGWLGDIGIFARTAMYQMDCREFLPHYLSVVVEAMHEDGAIPCIAPCPDGFLDNAVGASGWAEALYIITNDLYEFYGDKKIIEKYFPYGEKFLSWIENNSKDYRRNTYCFSDWLSMHADLVEGSGDVDFQLFDLYFYAIVCLYMAKFSKILGKTSESYTEKYEQAKQYFLEHLYKGGLPIGGGRQTALLLAYHTKFLTAEQIKDPLISDLENNSLTSGFIGTKYMLPTLAEIGRSDLAYKLITSTQYPSWGYSIVNGATTIWERWDSYTKEKGVCPHGMNSFNHFAFGSCVEWFYAGILGIRINNGKLLIKPMIDTSGQVTFANGHYDSIYGRIEVKWEITAKNKACIAINVPKNMNVEYDFGQWQIENIINNQGDTVYSLVYIQ